MKECSVVSCIKPAFRAGLCCSHYDKERLAKAPQCTIDGCDFPQHSVGLCNKHYRATLRNRPEKCKVEGCERAVVVHGLCDAHRKRLARTGNLDPIRPHDWGGRSSHPLYSTWKNLHRRVGQVPIHEPWMNDFWLFAKEIGDRPSLRHILRREDNTRAHGPGNSYWAASELSPIESGNRKEYMRLWHKQYRANNPERFRDKELRRRRGISAEEYDALFENQNGLCAICGNPETALNPLTGEPRALAVDHDHVTGKIRGLLCSGHNTGLGLFTDSPALLRAAITYLESHACDSADDVT